MKYLLNAFFERFLGVEYCGVMFAEVLMPNRKVTQIWQVVNTE